MALDGAGIGLAILFEMTRTIKSIQERNVCYKEGPSLRLNLNVTLERLTGLAENVDRILRGNPDVMPYAVLPDFIGILRNVDATLLETKSRMEEYCSKTSTESGSSSFLQKVANKGMCFWRAKSRNDLLVSIQRKTADAEKKLESLLIQLCTALKVDETILKLDERMRNLIEEVLRSQERFHPAFKVPMLPGKVYLDFESKDAGGKFNAPEADLKSFVLISTSSKVVTVARGASTATHLPVHGVSGMAGVGKTIALIGLGHDDDIKSHFADGVLFMTIGANATVGHLTSELCKIMRVTGAIQSAKEVQSAKTLADAVSNAAIWFVGKRILFLIDDIWPSPSRPEGYLPELEGLLQGCPESRFAISTRSLQVATKGGSYVDFGARDPCGTISFAIFMAHASPRVQAGDSHLEAARGILESCAGLPIALSVAGAAVSRKVLAGLRFEYACQAYFKKVCEHRVLNPGAKFLDTAIRISLTTLEEEHQSSEDGTCSLSVDELYESLCILDNQQFAPVPVLARMWGISEQKAEDVCVMLSSMSLAKMSTQTLDAREQCGAHIHDLHLDFCRQNASRNCTEKKWHSRLLNGHMEKKVSFGDVNDLHGFNLLQYAPPHWWEEDVPNKEYIRKHLSRHLRRAGRDLELGAIVLDIRWVYAQGLSGGFLRVKNDLDLLKAVVEEKSMSSGTSTLVAPVTILSSAIETMAGDFQNGIRVLTQILYGYLSGLSESNEWIRRYLEKMRQSTPKPVLAPTVSLYKHPVDHMKFHVELKLPHQNEFAYFCTDFSTCDTYCAAGADHDVAVYNLDSRNRLKWLKGHKGHVCVVKFSSDASLLVSGSQDRLVIVWDWKETESPCLVLEGHKGAVSSLSLNHNSSRIFSGSHDGTVRVWDVASGSTVREIAYDSEITCLSSCPSNELIAIGTGDGWLRCTNSESAECVFMHRLSDRAAISAVQFATDATVLISGASSGQATLWNTSCWETIAAVSMPGSVTHISFNANGEHALLGSSHGEIRHWKVSEEHLSPYNISMARPVNGLSFRGGDSDIIVGLKVGYARSWSGPLSNPNVDFEEVRSSILFDFSLSMDGTCVATTTHDGMIRIWNPYTGTQKVSYPAPADGSCRLALNVDGTRIASSSPNGTVVIWNPELPPSDADVSFTIGDGKVGSLSFSPDGSRLLICLAKEVEIWNWIASEKLGRVPNSGSLDTSSSADGRFIIVGDSKRTHIWDEMSSELVFDTGVAGSQTLSLSEAKQVIRTSGPSAYRMWPSSFRSNGAIACPPQKVQSLTVDNIYNFVSYHRRPSNMKFCKDVFVQNVCGHLSIFTLK